LIEHAGDEHARDRMAARLAIGFLRQQPWTALSLLPRKLWHLWLRDLDSDALGWNKTAFPVAAAGSQPAYAGRHLVATAASGRVGWLFIGLRALAALYYVAALALFCVGVYRLAAMRHMDQTGRPHAAGLWMIGYLTAFHLAFFGGSRFHAPIMPWVLMYAGLALAPVVHRRRS